MSAAAGAGPSQDDLKQVIAEWVLTNGKLPGFEERMTTTLPLWSVVGPDGMTVYRAQGGFVLPHSSSMQPNVITDGVRPVIATSKTIGAINRYAGSECCIFEIKLQPGTRYLDVNQTVTFLDADRGKPALGIKNAVLSRITEMCPASGSFPSTNTPLFKLREIILDRCNGRVKGLGTESVEYIPSEQEIMVDGIQGTFSKATPIEPKNGKQTFQVTYGPRKGGRGRTFRRKAKTSNKNGHRFTRKSKHRVRRDSHA
jgi:hypothetical protein